MKRFLEAQEQKYVPQTGYRSFCSSQAKCGYYSQVRPYSHYRGLTPNESEKRYWLK